MLYIGTAEELPLRSSADLRIETVDATRLDVKQWFSFPAVHFVGAHTGCSCGSVGLRSRLDGMPLASDDRAADLRSVRALIELLGQVVSHPHAVELYPVADGDEANPPKGVIEWELRSIDPQKLFFNERFMHIVR